MHAFFPMPGLSERVPSFNILNALKRPNFISSSQSLYHQYLVSFLRNFSLISLFYCIFMKSVHERRGHDWATVLFSRSYCSALLDEKEY